MFLISSCSRLCPNHWSRVFSQEWRCSWISAARQCSKYIWVINNSIAYWGVTYIRGLTVMQVTCISWCYIIHNTWKDSTFHPFFNLGPFTNIFLVHLITHSVPYSLESPLEAMAHGLKDVFRRLYIVPGRPGLAVPSNVRVGLEMVHESVRKALWDYKDVLAVKALRNITITSYPFVWVTVSTRSYLCKRFIICYYLDGLGLDCRTPLLTELPQYMYCAKLSSDLSSMRKATCTLKHIIISSLK